MVSGNDNAHARNGHALLNDPSPEHPIRHRAREEDPGVATATELTADAGNLLVNNDGESDLVDSKLAAEGARKFNDAINIIQTIKGEREEYKFQGVDLSPKPVLEIIPDANQLHQSTPN